MLTINSPYIEAGVTIQPTSPGELSSFHFSVKDVFDIKNHIAGLGNPIWKQTHQPASHHAIAIRKLLNAGAALTGITISDEFMFSIKGKNVHYGDPLNPKHPTCYPGGSSSGSASAVASDLVDFALGTDTGGSIRVPASYCGLFGFRPTHSMTLLDGVAPLATSFDTVGILAKSPQVLEQVGSVLYGGRIPLHLKTLYYLVDDQISNLSFNYLDNVADIQAKLGLSNQQVKPFRLPSLFNLSQLQKTFKRIQGFEAWKNYGPWLKAHRPNLGADIAEHFAFASTIKSDRQLTGDYTFKNDFSIYLQDILTNQAMLLLPTTPGPALEKDISFQIGEQIRLKTQKLTSLAGLAGVPQVAMPISTGQQENSLSIITGVETDLALLKLALKLNE